MPANQKRTSKAYYEVQAKAFHDEFLLVTQLQANDPEASTHQLLRGVRERLRRRPLPGGRRFACSTSSLYGKYYRWSKNGRSPEALFPQYKLTPTFGKKFEAAIARLIYERRPVFVREILKEAQVIAKALCGRAVSYPTLARVVARVPGARQYWQARRAQRQATSRIDRLMEAFGAAQPALSQTVKPVRIRKEAK